MGYINPITKYLSEIYVINGIDVLNYLITNENFITYHHLIACRELKVLEFPRDKTIENGIALSFYGHNYLHYIEHFDNDIFLEINKVLLLITKERRLPTFEERVLIENLLARFEHLRKGHRKIPNKYLSRTLIKDK